MALEDFNGTRSVIIDEVNGVYAAPPTAEAILIVGTAKKGEKKVLIPLSDGIMSDTFGDIPSDPSEDTNLHKSYLEVSRSTTNGASCFGLVVGDSTKATLEMFEVQGIGSGYGALGSGDYGYSQDELLNTLTKCLVHEAKIEGDVPNKGTVEVIDESGVPKAITFTTPDGVRKSFGLDPFGKSPNALANVREIADRFNSDADWSKWYTTRYGLLRQKDLEVIVQKDSTGTFIEINPSGAGESYGDKLESLEEIAIVDENSKDIVSLGSTTASLKFLPEKDSTANTRTINKFVRKIKDEQVMTIDATLVGSSTTNKTIYLGKPNSKWDGDIGFVFTADPNDPNFGNFKLDIIRTGTGNRVSVPKTNTTTNQPVYWVDATGQLFIDMSAIGQTFILGDTFLITYKYPAFYKEADVRSQLEVGNEFNYFVKGYDIIFGASTSTELEIYYKTRKLFSSSDINITDSRNIIIYFENPFTRPAVGSKVLATYTYLPELPAASGTILRLPNGDNVFQKSGFSGGDDGRRITKQRYKELVKEALNLVQSYPFKQVLISGAYLDDTVQDFDDETGKPAVIPVDWLSTLGPIMKDRGYLVKEATMNIGIRPPVLQTPEAVNEWFNRAIVNDAADVGRAANMIDAARGPGMFRFNCIAGAPIMAISQIRNGARFIANPAAVYAGLMYDSIIEQSLTNSLLPTSVLALAVKTMNAKTIGDMNAKKYTFMTEDPAGNRIIADAPTMAVNGSSFDRQFVVMAAFAAIDIIRTTAQRYIGQPRNNEVIIAMKNKCQKNVQYLVPKVFSDIRIDVVEVPDGNITGRTKLKITMITTREIRVVELETRLQIA